MLITRPKNVGIIGDLHHKDVASIRRHGTTASSPVPQAVAALAGTKALAAGPINGLALRAGGAAVAWGSNAARTVGDGTTIDRLAPVTIAYSRGSTPLASYVYNGDGLRAKKTVAGVTTSFTWDSSSGLPLLVDDGTNYYIYGPGGQPLEHIDRTGAVTWYHQDQLGSTRLLTNNTGATVGTATYDPYGRLTASTGKLSPLGFAGEYTDTETGFSYLRARYYDPTTGQFLTRDPLGPGAGHPYAYVSGNPLNLTDPSGLCPFCVPLLGAAIAGLADIGLQVAMGAINGCGFSLSNVNWTQVTISAAMGLMSPGQAASRIGARAATQAVPRVARGAIDDGVGIVYRRIDLAGGKPYVGQSINEGRFLTRQSEHARALPDADFEFAILGRARPGQALDRLEEFFIRQGGGPSTRRYPDGGLANRRHQMSDRRYAQAGGDY